MATINANLLSTLARSRPRHVRSVSHLIVTGDITLTPEQVSGTAVVTTAAATITLPAAIVGLEATFLIGGTGTPLTINPVTGDFIRLINTSNANDGVTNVGTTGVMIWLYCGLAGEWTVLGKFGTWTVNAL